MKKTERDSYSPCALFIIHFLYTKFNRPEYIYIRVYIRLRMQLIHITPLLIERKDRVTGVTDFAKMAID